MGRIFLRFSALMCIFFFLLLMGWRQIAPHFSGQMIGYVSSSRENRGIWSLQFIDLRTQYQQSFPANHLSPATFDWSPDCKQLVFVSTTDETNGVYVFDWHTFNVTSLAMPTDQTNYVYPRWSPTQEQILLIRTQFNLILGQSRDVILYDLNTEKVDVLLENIDGGIFPDWAPDGTKFVYQKADILFDLMEYDITNHTQERLTFLSGLELSPDYSPDGKSIAFSKEVRGRSNIFLMNIETGDAKMISRNYSNAISPTWSPDGKFIAYARGTGTWVNNIFVMNLSTGEEIALTDHSSWALFPRWSPCQ